MLKRALNPGPRVNLRHSNENVAGKRYMFHSPTSEWAVCYFLQTQRGVGKVEHAVQRASLWISYATHVVSRVQWPFFYCNIEIENERERNSLSSKNPCCQLRIFQHSSHKFYGSIPMNPTLINMTYIDLNWPTLSEINKHLRTLTDIDKHWLTLIDTDRHRQTSTDINRHFQTSIDIDRYLQTSTAIDRHQQTWTDINSLR